MEEHRFILLEKRLDGKIFGSEKAKIKKLRKLKNKKLNNSSISSNAVRRME
jgi:hypothetical protein